MSEKGDEMKSVLKIPIVPSCETDDKNNGGTGPR